MNDFINNSWGEGDKLNELQMKRATISEDDLMASLRLETKKNIR